MAGENPRKLDALTSLRFFAAALIVVGHSLDIFKFESPLLRQASLSQGVSFFFVLSGFILAYVYPSLDSGAAIRRFLRARIARIWPAHLTTFLVTILLLDLPLSWIAAANLAMVQAWIPFGDYFFSYNSPSWSISTEFFFYLAFPILIRNWSETWRVKLLVSGTVLLVIILTANVLALPPYPSPGLTYTALVYIHPLARIFEFIFGMTCYLVWRRVELPRLNSRLVATAAELVLIGLCLTSILFTKAAGRTLWGLLGPAGVEWFGHSGSFVLFGALIVVMARGRGAVSGFLSQPFFVLLGEISYSVYLLQYIFFVYYDIHADAYAAQSPLQSCLLYCLLTLLASYCCWRFIERPARAFLVSPRWRGPVFATPTFAGPTSRWALLLSAAIPLGALALVAGAVYLPVGKTVERFSQTAPTTSAESRVGGVCNVESARILPTGGTAGLNQPEGLVVTGWAVDFTSMTVPKRLYVRLVSERGTTYYAEAVRHLNRNPRPDVARHFGSEKLSYAGWKLVADPGMLPSGTYKIEIIQDGGISALLCPAASQVRIGAR